jgi:N-methylhydantoinase A
VRVGIDTGGTFTDLVASGDDGEYVMSKTLSTPAAPADSTADALRKAGLGEHGAVETLVHGTTIATNALIEREGAVVGLITTRGFRDVLSIQRVIRPRSFDIEWVRPRPLTPRRLVAEVTERVDAAGAVRTPLDEAELLAAVDDLLAKGVEAIAISFLFAFLEPAHEQRARELIVAAHPDLAVSISSAVFPQWREYERTSTCVIDAFLKPRVDRYANELERMAGEQGIGELLVMRSNGGSVTTEGVREKPVAMVRSGPAGGMIASVEAGRETGFENLILADMGGTSFDTGLIRAGEPALTTQAELEWGIPIAVPMVDVRSVGAGGGSIAWIDAAGILRVGPESAGARPGPACYGQGGEHATVTDANLVLGRLGDDLPLAGDVALDRELAVAAIAPLAEALDRSVEDLALGIVEIADSNMAQALRLVSIDNGHDPRDFALIAFGGAGPLHASALARALGMTRVVVPRFPGAFSAYGALIAETRFDYMRTYINRGRSDDELAAIDALFADLEQRAETDLRRERIEAGAQLTRSVEMRYVGQNWELEVPLADGPASTSVADARDRFHAAHERQFGWSLPDGDLELVNFKLVASVARPKAPPRPLEPGPLPEPVRRRAVRFAAAAEPLDTPIYWRDELPAGARLSGPAIVAETDSTLLLAPGDELEALPGGQLVVNVAEEEAR